MLIGIASIAAERELAAQRPTADVRIISATDVSSDTLQVTVEYMYRGELLPGGVWLHATPEEEGGVFDPRTVRFDELPVRPGVFTHTLTITKRPDERDFTSVAVRVCLSTTDSALVCRDFPHRKQWAAAAPATPPPDPTPPDPPTPPAPPTPQTCSISGHVDGPLEMELGPDHPGGVSESIRLRHIVAARPDGTTIRAEVQHRRFVFRSLPAGVNYRVAPGGFPSNPRSKKVICRPGIRHIVNFRITR
jgi:hypothetical protein